MRLTLITALLYSLLCGAVLSGCGQKGPLFIPSDTPPGSSAQ